MLPVNMAMRQNTANSFKQPTVPNSVPRFSGLNMMLGAIWPKASNKRKSVALTAVAEKDSEYLAPEEHLDPQLTVQLADTLCRMAYDLSRSRDTGDSFAAVALSPTGRKIGKFKAQGQQVVGEENEDVNDLEEYAYAHTIKNTYQEVKHSKYDSHYITIPDDIHRKQGGVVIENSDGKVVGALGMVGPSKQTCELIAVKAALSIPELEDCRLVTF